MASSIRKAKAEISAMKPPGDDSPNSTRRFNLATEELDAIVHSTERATTDILNGAERIMEVNLRLRENGNTLEADQIDLEATNILMACGFQDITGQRISKVVSTLRYLEERVDAMIRSALFRMSVVARSVEWTMASSSSVARLMRLFEFGASSPGGFMAEISALALRIDEAISISSLRSTSRWTSSAERWLARSIHSLMERRPL
jgi:hypothetical protein